MLESALAMPPGADGRVIFEEHAHPGWRTFAPPPHAHRFLEVQLVTRGTGVVVLGQHRMRMSVGTLFWVPPRLEHFSFDTSASFRRYSLSMRPIAVQRALGKATSATLLRTHDDHPLAAHIETAEVDRLATLLKEVRTLGGQHATLLNTGLAYCVARILVAFRGASARDEATTIHPAVAGALLLMRGDGLRLSRSELAEHLGTSVSVLSRLFSRELGQTLRDVRSGRRVERVVELLRTGAAETLTEAALEAGFGTYSQFHRIYRKRMGGSPAQQLMGRTEATPRRR